MYAEIKVNTEIIKEFVEELKSVCEKFNIKTIEVEDTKISFDTIELLKNATEVQTEK